MPHARSRSALVPGILLAIGASALIAGGVPVAPQVVRSGAIHDLTAAGIARFETFVPALPAGLPASFDVVVPLGAREVTLSMAKTSHRGDSFRVLVDRGAGILEEVTAPDVRTYTGTIAGEPGSRVGLSLLPLGPGESHVISGMVHEAGGRSWAIQPLAELVDASVPTPAGAHVSFASEDSFLNGGGCALGQVGFPLDAFRSDLSRALADGKAGRSDSDSGSDEGGIAGATPWQVVVACDTDFEFYQRNNSSVTSTVNDMELILNNVNVVYDRDVDIVFEIGTLVVRSTSDDPYTATTMDGRLTEFRNTWATAPESGIFRNISHLFSGFAYTGSAAGTLGIAYLGGVCSGVTQIQYGAVQGRQSFTTTNTNNRIALSSHELGHNWNATHCDSAGSANCNIMCSGLGGCGGISGSNLRFNPVSINEMTNFRNAVSCDFQRPAAVAMPFEETFPTLTVSTARWIYNDGGVITTAAPNEPSAPYSMALNSTGSGPYDQDELRSNFILLAGINDARVSVKVLRGSSVEEGKTLIVEYFNNVLKWVELATLVSDGVAQSQFVPHEWPLPANASHDRFRIRFRVQGTDTSDTWYIDDVTVTRAPSCPADVDNDGQVNAIDLSTILANWGGSGSGDVDGNGIIDGIDLGSVLAAWGPCP
jgi:hypothetical protein